MYYKYIDRLVSSFAAEARSIIDVGSANAAYLEAFDWISERHTLDKRKAYSSEKVRGITADFFEFQPPHRYDFATCLQVLEHVEDAASFVDKLFSIADNVLISVPYKWNPPAKSHIHDPVDRKKLFSWTRRKPDYEVLVTEPLIASCYGQRLIAYYHDPSEKFDLKKYRERSSG